MPGYYNPFVEPRRTRAVKPPPTAGDVLDDEITSWSQRKSDAGRYRQGVAQQIDDFLNAEGSDLFERGVDGKLLKGPDGTFVPKLGLEVESLKSQAEKKTGLLRAAFSSAETGDPTPDALEAQKRLAQIEPTFRLKQERYERLKAEHDRAASLEQEAEVGLGRLAQTRLQAATVTPEDILDAVDEVNAGRASLGTPPVSLADVAPQAPAPQQPTAQPSPGVFDELAANRTGGPRNPSVQQLVSQQQQEKAKAAAATTVHPPGQVIGQATGVDFQKRVLQRSQNDSIAPDEAHRLELARAREEGISVIDGMPISDLIAATGGEEAVASAATLETVRRLSRRLGQLDDKLGGTSDVRKVPRLKAERDIVANVLAKKQALIDAIPTEQRIKSALGSLVAGVAEIPAATADFVAISAKKIDELLPEFMQEYEDKQVNELATAKFAQALRNAAQGVAPRDPALADEFWSGRVPNAIGSMLAFLGATALTKRPIVTPLVLGGATGGSSGYKEALEAGADESTATKSLLLNAGVGLTEVVPIASMFNRLNRASGGGLKRALIDAGVEGAEEWAQEFFQTTAGNAIARELYDAERPLFEDSLPNGNAGGVSGVLASLLVSAVGKQRGGSAPTPTATPQPTGGDSSGRKEVQPQEGRQAQGRDVLIPPRQTNSQEAQGATSVPSPQKPESTPGTAATPDSTTAPTDSQPAAVQAPAEEPAEERPPNKAFEFHSDDEGRAVTVVAPSLAEAAQQIPKGFKISRVREKGIAPTTPKAKPAEAQTIFDFDPEEVGARERINRRMAGGMTREQALATDRESTERTEREVDALPQGSRIERKGTTFELRGSLWTNVENEEQVSTRLSLRGGKVVRVGPAKEVAQLEGEKINRSWTAFAPESQSLGIPRAEMPQVKAEHRGALTQFLKARGVAHAEEEVLPTTLKPTQAEYSQAKVDKAREFTGGDRAILVSSDNHVVDGHHQWMAKLTDAPGQPMRVIRLNAPIRELLPQVGEFPSVEAAGGATKVTGAAADQGSKPGEGYPATGGTAAPSKGAVGSEAGSTRVEGQDAGSARTGGSIPLAPSISPGPVAPQRGPAKEPTPQAAIPTPAAPGPATVPAAGPGVPAIARGKTTGEGLAAVAIRAAKLKQNHRAAKFLTQFAGRLAKGNREALLQMEVHVRTQAQWDADDRTRSMTPDSAGAYDPESNTLYLNSDKLDGENVASVIVHEAGHFAEKFALGEGFTQREWESLYDDQREKAAREYNPDDTRDGTELITDRRARAEWVAMQFSRVVRGETEGMSQPMLERLKAWLQTVRELVNRWVGDGQLTTPELDAKILEFLGYSEEAPTARPAVSSTEGTKRPGKTKKDRRDESPGVAAQPAAAPGNSKSAIDDLADKLFDGLLGTPPVRLEQKAFPKERRQMGIDLADAMIAAGINTPEAMARYLDQKFDKKARGFSDSLWSLFRFSEPSLQQAPDWNTLYSQLDAPAQPEQISERETEPPVTKPDGGRNPPGSDRGETATGGGQPDQNAGDAADRPVLGGTSAEDGETTASSGAGSADVSGESSVGPSIPAGQGDGGQLPDVQRGDGSGGAGQSPDGGRGRKPRTRKPSVGASPAVDPDAPTPPARENYRIKDPEALVGGGPKARFAKNQKAIETYLDLTASNREPSPAELDAIASYIGWGSFGQELFQGSWDRSGAKPEWSKEDQWLRDHLGREEWESMQRSIINAHYTDPITVSAMWDVAKRLGFTGGRVLEPGMGIGNFYGLMPVHLAKNSQLTGIELDRLTGGMAKILYPNANIQIKGYQDSKTADNFYDLVIGNWPFANITIADRRYDRLSPSLHNYYFLKALDQVRPGGIVMGITSNSTMDQKTVGVRVALARKAELIGAYRLPAGAFEKYAGTKVVTDILIFKKRAEPLSFEKVTDAGWINTVAYQTPNGHEIEVNEYWAKNPDNVLGTLNWGSGTTTGRPGMIVERPSDYETRLRDLAKRVPKNVMVPWDNSIKRVNFVGNDTKARQNAIIAKGAKFFQVQGEHLAPLDEVIKWQVKDERKTAARAEQLRSLIGLRDGLTTLLYDQSVSASDLSVQRKALKAQYDAFVAKHGPVTESPMLAVMVKSRDLGARLLANVERKDAAGRWVPREILTTDIVRRGVQTENLDIEDAYSVDRYQNVNIDIARIAKMANATEEEVIDRLTAKGQVFKTPTGLWEARDQYLSGNVRQKLREATDAKEQGTPGMERNIEALTAIVPKDVPYVSIEPQLGATWVRNDYYRTFIKHLLGLSDSDLQHVTVEQTVRGYKITLARDYLVQRSEATTLWGTRFISWRKIIDAAFNNGTVKIFDTDSDGKQFVDEAATRASNDKINAIREEFKAWIWKDPERAIDLQNSYNDTFNSNVTPDYDGSHLRLVGLSLNLGTNAFDFRSHQKNAVWRFIVNGRGIGAHEVGTGKTFTIAGLAMESRRLGMFRKPLILAHNANSSSIAGDMQLAYPGAKVLYIDNLSPDNRDASMQQIALDEWDAVVMPHSLIDRMALREETMMEQARELIAELEQEAIDAAAEDGVTITVSDMDSGDYKKILARTGATAKELVKQRERILETIRKQAQKVREDSVFFEDLGIDAVIVDEAHIFKKIPIATRQKLKGLNKAGSNRSVLLTMLTDYVKSKHGGKGTFLFTGTPITNTVNEVFNMMRYTMSDIMERDGVKRWDAWFNAFAEGATDVELTGGGTWEPVERLTQFVNVPELARFAAQVFDVVYAKNMPEFKPRDSAEGRDEEGRGRPFKQKIDVTVPMSDAQRAHLADIQRRAKEFKEADGKTKRLMMLSGDNRSPIIYEGEGVKAALDYRLLDLNAPDDPNSKVNTMIARAMQHYVEHPNTAQMIFMERGYYDHTTRSRKLADGSRESYRVPAFNLAQDIIDKLVAQGVPRSEIVVFPWLSKEKRKLAAEAMRRGEIRWAIGGTETMGTGVNAQDELIAMHHLDAPWMPGELEQRNGRGWRQGNKWNTVREYRYFTEGSHDGRRWQILLTKDKFIRRFVDAVYKKGEIGLRIIDGEGADLSEGQNEETDNPGDAEADFGESFAAAVGDPRIIQRAKLQRKIETIERRRAQFIGAQRTAADEISRQRSEAKRIQSDAGGFRTDAQRYAENKPDPFAITLQDPKTYKSITFTDRAAADEMLDAIGKEKEARRDPNSSEVGSYAGFKITVGLDPYSNEQQWTVRGAKGYGTGGTIASIEANLRYIGTRVEKAQERVAEIDRGIANLQTMLNAPFSREAQLQGLRKQLEQIERELAASPSPPPAWLRNGAPVGSLVVIDGKSYDVAAHRWDANNWWLLVVDPEVDGAEMVPFAYDKAFDADGNALFESRPFEAPAGTKTEKPSGTTSAAPVGPASTPNAFFRDEMVESPGLRGVWQIAEIRADPAGSDNEALWSVVLRRPGGKGGDEIVSADKLTKVEKERADEIKRTVEALRVPLPQNPQTQFDIPGAAGETPKRTRLRTLEDRMQTQLDRLIELEDDAVGDDAKAYEKRVNALERRLKNVRTELQREESAGLARAKSAGDLLGSPADDIQRWENHAVALTYGKPRGVPGLAIERDGDNKSVVWRDSSGYVRGVVNYDATGVREIGVIGQYERMGVTSHILDFVRSLTAPNANGTFSPAAMRALRENGFKIASESRFSLFGSPPVVKGTATQEAILNRVTGTLEDKRGLTEKFRDFLIDTKDYVETELKQKLVDRFASIKRLERAILGNADIDASASAYKFARLTGNLPSVMEFMLQHGPVTYAAGSMTRRMAKMVYDDGAGVHEEYDPQGLLTILKPLTESGKTRLWEGYVAAYRANRLLAEGKEQNFASQAEIDELLALAQKHPEFEAIRRQYVAFQRATLDVAESAGLVTADQRAMWEKADYVPFYRIMDTLDNKDVKGPYKRRGIANQRSGIKKLKGSENAVAILENIYRNLETLVDASFKNIAMQRVTALAGVQNNLITKIPYQSVPFKSTVDEALKLMQAQGIPTANLTKQELESLITFWRSRAPQGKDVVSVMVNGKAQYYRVNDAPLLRSILAMGPDRHALWMRMLMAPRRALTNLVTLDPAFMVANTVRDSFSAWVIADSPIKPGIDSAIGMVKALRNDPSKLTVMAAGGGSGHYNRLTEGEVRKGFHRMTPAQKKTFTDSILDSPGKVWRMYKDIGRATENANRLAIFDAAKKKGASDAEAAFQALDIMDFGLRGDSRLLTFFLDTVPFLNARLQGLYRLGRGLKHHPARVATHGAIIMGATLALLGLNWDNEEYWQLQEWDRDQYYHLWLGGNHYRIPKPFEVGQIFSTIPERMVEVGGKTGDTDILMQRMASMVRDTFAFNPIPQAFKPVAERAMNLNTFTGAPIISAGDQFKPPEQQFGPLTSETVREIAQAMPDSAPEWMRSPKTLEHFIRGYFGSIGMQALNGADALTRTLGDFPAEPAKRPGDYWLVSRFAPEDEGKATKYVGQFYDLHKEVMKLREKSEELRKSGALREAAELEAENRDLLGFAPRVKSAYETMQSIRQRQRQVYDSRGLSEEQKRTQLNQLGDLRNRTARATVEANPRRPRPFFNPFSSN